MALCALMALMALMALCALNALFVQFGIGARRLRRFNLRNASRPKFFDYLRGLLSSAFTCRAVSPAFIGANAPPVAFGLPVSTAPQLFFRLSVSY
jgi:hypothetical protein